MERLQQAFRLLILFVFCYGKCVAIVFIYLDFIHYYLPHDSQTQNLDMLNLKHITLQSQECHSSPKNT